MTRARSRSSAAVSSCNQRSLAGIHRRRHRPLWARSGKELLFLSSTGELIHVDIEPSVTWAATTPTKVLGPSHYYDRAGGYQRMSRVNVTSIRRSSIRGVLLAISHGNRVLAARNCLSSKSRELLTEIVGLRWRRGWESCRQLRETSMKTGVFRTTRTNPAT